MPLKENRPKYNFRSLGNRQTKPRNSTPYAMHSHDLHNNSAPMNDGMKT